MGLERVHDFDGEWFAMPPSDPIVNSIVRKMYGDAPLAPPDVGDVIANTRTESGHNIRDGSDGPNGIIGWQPEQTVWADPPFLRVAEVLPIIEGTAPRRDMPPRAMEIHPDGESAWATFGRWRGIVTHLPGAVPGGWAIQVGPLTLSDEVTSDLHADRSLPPPTSTPLNGPFG